MAKASFKVSCLLEMEVTVDNEYTLEDCEDVIRDSGLEKLMKEQEYYIDRCDMQDICLKEVLEASYIIDIYKIIYYKEEDSGHKHKMIQNFGGNPKTIVVNDVNVSRFEHHLYDEIEAAAIDKLEEENLYLYDIVSIEYKISKEY